MLRVTDRGLDRYEEHIAQMREVLGWRTPLAIDHVGHMGLDDAKRLMKRLEKYNLLWCEDVLPWYMVDEYVELRQYATTPLATGEDAYLTESFEPLIQNGTMRPNDKPGLGMEDFNDEVLREHQWKGSPEIWQSTEEWDKEYSYDRLWS